VKICVSNGLDVDSLQELLNRGAEIDTLGIGDNIVAPKERADHVYKLVAVQKEKGGEITSRIKVSGETAKTINPGFKKVVRFYDKDTNKVLGDTICLRDEEINKENYTLVDHNNTWKKTELTNYTVRNLQVPIFVNGELVYDIPSLKLRREYANEEYQTLTDRITDPINPHTYYVDLSENLRNLKEEMLHKATLDVEQRKQAYQKSLGEMK
ncbi:MAG: nicotinate phosphoribosyltransferase, partial [Bacilli bacterium]|nr:nicotinate phosphoribosyltransferase [Bacilli bacterium]